MKPSMRKILSQLLLLSFGVGITLAASAFAYTNPTNGPDKTNAPAPINTDTVDQVKNGGLSVNAFTANKDAWFQQGVTFSGLVRGGTPADTSSTIAVGGVDGTGTHQVDLSIVGTIKGKDTIQADDLRSSNARPLCADQNGEIVFCPDPVNPIDGACGDIKIYDGQPYTLCNAGTVTDENHGQCTWTWTCEGANGGSDTSCSAEFYHWDDSASPAGGGTIQTDFGGWATC